MGDIEQPGTGSGPSYSDGTKSFVEELKNGFDDNTIGENIEYLLFLSVRKMFIFATGKVAGYDYLADAALTQLDLSLIHI